MGAEISKLSVVLAASAAGFASGMSQASAAMEGVATTAEHVGGVLESFTHILGGIGLIGLFEGSAEHFKETEQSAATLAAVVRATGEAAGISSGEMQEMAESLASTSTFSKSAVMDAEAVIATFRNIKGDQFKETTKAALDMAAVLGTDAKSAAMQLGKALNDPAEGLKKLAREGVTFDEHQVALIQHLTEMGDVAGAQRVMLDELAHEFGGAAEAAGGTFSNQIEKGKEAAMEIGAALAEVLAPALAKLADMMKEAAAWVKEHHEALQTLGKIIVGVVAAVAAYKLAMLALVVAQKAWAAGQAIVLALQGPGGWLILAGAAAAAAVGVAAVNSAFDGIEDKAKKAGVSANDAMNKIGGGKIADLDEDGPTGKSAKKLAEHIAQVTERLKEQVATFGMTSHEAEVYKLKMEGATDAQLKQADALAKQLEQLDAQKEAMKEAAKEQEKWAQAAQKMYDETRTPAEQLWKVQDEINEAFKRGLIDADTFDRAMARAQGEFNRAMEKHERKGKPWWEQIKNAYGSNTAALEHRFTAGFKVDNDDKWNKVLKYHDREAKAAERTAKAVETMASEPDQVVSIS